MNLYFRHRHIYFKISQLLTSNIQISSGTMPLRITEYQASQQRRPQTFRKTFC